MAKTYLYAGTSIYGNSLGIYIFEIDQIDGRLHLLGTASELKNPSYQQVYTKKQLLFSTGQITTENGIEKGVIASYDLDEKTGSLTLINTVCVGSKAPCHISINSDCSYLFSANYAEATVHVIPVNPDGILNAPSCIIKRSGSGKDKERQDSAHAHYASLTPDEKYLCVADLGTDEVAVYSFDKEPGKLSYEPELTISIEPGSGPRHLIFHPSGNHMYLVNELSSDVIVYSYKKGEFQKLQSISTLPTGYTGHSQCAAIKLSVDASMLFASNRGHESIACFSIAETALLTFNGAFDASGRHPRDFSIKPDGGYLYSANMHSDNISVFRMVPEGIPQQTGYSTIIPAPACISFYSQDI